MGKFDEFIYTIPKRYTECGETYVSPRAYFQGTESLWNANLRMGFSVIQKDTIAEFPHVHHAVEEYYMFFGPDLTNFFDVDVEIEMWIGDDPDNMEKHVINRPTIVRIPPRIWHGPINYKRVGKPIAFSSLYFDGEASKITRRINKDGSVVYPYLGSSLKRCYFDKAKNCENCGKCMREYNGHSEKTHHPNVDFAYTWAKEIVNSESTPRSGKYDNLFFEFPVEYHNYGDIYANPRGKFRGITQMPDCNFYGGFSVALKPTKMEDPHIHHSKDEYLWFTGSDMANIFDFDGEVELYLGWNPDEMEKIVITESTVVRVPPNMWHTPINFKRVDKPIAFLPVYGDGDWSKIIRKQTKDEEYEYLFESASLRKCVYNHDAICNYCGKCLSDDSVPSFGTFTHKKK